MEKKTRVDIGCERTDGGKFYRNSAAVVPEKSIADALAKVEFADSVEDFMAEERATSTVDYSKPVQVIRPFIVPDLIDEDLKLSSSKEEEENIDDSNKENRYDDSANKENDCLKKKMNDALMKSKKIAEEEEQLLNELKRVRVRAAEIDREYREYQEKIAIINYSCL